MVKVALGVISIDQGYLLSLRPSNTHLADHWEFPGGKIEQSETSIEALKRELHEEIGIQVIEAQCFLVFSWQYADLNIEFHCFLIDQFRGTPTSKEGQRLEGYSFLAMKKLRIPAANQYLINALMLPQTLAISPQLSGTAAHFQQCLKQFDDPQRMVRIRVGDPAIFTIEQWQTLAIEAQKTQTFILFEPAVYEHIRTNDYCGIHLKQDALMTNKTKPQAAIVGASCHDAASLNRALALGMDYVLLSPILSTNSHPDIAGMGWQKMQSLIQSKPTVVYALGGMQQSHLKIARKHQAHGIAGISDFWLSK